MCTTDSIPDPKHPTADGSSVVVLRPTQILDPYPERLTNLAGVRSYTALSATRTRESTDRFARGSRRHPFGASILITLVGQGLLAATIATRTLSPAIGAAASVGFLLCGLGLILAEAIQAGGR